MLRRLIIVCVLLLAGAFAIGLSHARDAGQWEATDPDTRAWFNTLKQPDTGVSCCGEADGYWADHTQTRAGQLIAFITDDRDDVKLGRRHIPNGTEFVIPPHKITWKHGNPTGHLVIFINAADQVLCFVQNGGY